MVDFRTRHTMKIARACLLLLLAALLVSTVHASADVDPVITAFYMLQNQGQCKDFVALFASNFTVIDPLGSDPVTSANDMLTACLSNPQTFSVVNMFILNAYSPMPNATAVQWKCTNVALNGCKLDFEGVDVFTLEISPSHASKIRSMIGYFDPSIPGTQINCTHA